MLATIRLAFRGERFRLWSALALVSVGFSALTRITLFVVAVSASQVEPTDLPGVLAIGAFYDVVTAMYLLAPLALYLVLIPDRVLHARWHRWVLSAMTALTVFGLVYLGAVEFFFFDEFNSRFNFVAVEYLIYPHEVFINIWDTYPVATVLLVCLLATIGVMWGVRHALPGSLHGASRLQGRMVAAGGLGLVLTAAHAGVNITSGHYSDNRVVNELALNGVYAFFNAAMHADLDYPAFYLTLPDEEADTRLRNVVAPAGHFLTHGEHLGRRVEANGRPKMLNVIVLLQESLGAEFVGAYGDKRGLTPNLDKLAQSSLLFTRAYATGTRTVRGMEAVTASFPPVPPVSLVKRPRNSGLFNWSTVMAKAGYSPTFIYGGYGTFDNMNAFFGSNGYKVIDRTDMDQPGFANIWGVSDEDLFRNAVRVFDKQHERGERVFSVVMSTSNHQPFTFPAGVPGVPETGGGREAGIRYADYAIGRFLDMARSRPWFDDTLFVIVADHGARVYGRENIPVATYEIPLLVYSPKWIEPARVDTLTSQIDVAPTVLGLLDFSYESTFFGIDVLSDAAAGRFIPLNHNRDIALFDGERIVQIGFNKTATQFRYNKALNVQTVEPLDTERLKDAIAVYQEGYEMYQEGIYRLPEQVEGD